MRHLVFEVGLALILMAAAGRVAALLRVSIVPFLILAGMAVGPHAPHWGAVDLRFLHSAPFLEFMGRLGVLFLLFYLGLEFSVGRLLRAGRSILVGGSIYMGINFTLALLFGWLMGWPTKEILVAAGITTTSSSAIVAKVLVDLKRTANPETEMILGIIMFEDVFLAVYLSILSGLVLSGASAPAEVVAAGAIALGFMLAMLVLGRRAVPWLNRRLNVPSDELFLLIILAALLAVAGFGETIHVAEAIGALLVGLVLAETEHRKRIEHLILPLRDVFAAFFFFSFGLSIDPLALGGAVGPAMAAVALTLVGNFVAGMLAGRTARLSPRASANVGLSIVSRGEFSIIMANLAEQGGLLPLLQPFAALYVLVLAVVGPLVTKESKRIYQVLNRIFRWSSPAGVQRQAKRELP